MKLNGDLVLNTGGNSEIVNLHVEQLAADPSFSASEEGRIYFNTGSSKLKLNDGVSWEFMVSGDTNTDFDALEDTVANLITTQGALTSASGVYDGSAMDALLANVTASSSLSNLLDQLDAAISVAAGVDTLGELTDVTLTAPAAGMTLRFTGSGDNSIDSFLALSDLSDGNITAVANGHVLYADTGVFVNAAPGATSGVQAYDAALTSIAGLTIADNSFLVGTGAEAFAVETPAQVRATLDLEIGTDVQAFDATILVDADIGSSVQAFDATILVDADIGSTVQAQDADLDAIVTAGGVVDNEFLVGSGNGTYVYENESTVRTTLGLVAGGAGDIWVEKGGDVMSGNLLMGTNKITGLGNPSEAQDASTKFYVDSVASGLDVKQSVRLATTSELTVTAAGTGVNKTLTVDAVGIVAIDGQDLTAAEGFNVTDRMLIKDQSTVADNGIYTITTLADAGDVEVVEAEFSGETIVGGDHFTLSAPVVGVNGGDFYVWFTVDAGGADPAPGGTGLLVAVVTGDDAADRAILTAAVLDAEPEFDAPVPGGTVVEITMADAGDVTDAADNNSGVAFTVTTQGGVAAEDTNIEFSGQTIVGGDHWTLSAPVTGANGGDFYVWYTVQGVGNDPAPGGTGLLVAVLTADTAAQRAVKTAAVLDAEAEFGAPVPGGTVVVITNADAGDVTDAADADAGIAVTVNTQGSGSSAVFTRATDADEDAEVTAGMFMFVAEGTTNADQGFVLVTNDPIVVDTTDQLFTQFTGAGSFSAGIGLAQDGNILNINMGAGIVELPSDEVGLDLYDVANNPLILTNDGSTRGTLTGDQLALLLDSTTLSKGTAGLKVASGGITGTELNTSVAGDGLDGGGGSALSLDLKTASGLAITSTELDLVNVPNSALANSSITIDADTGTDEVLSLGDTLILAGGTNIGTVGSATDTVTINWSANIEDLGDVTLSSITTDDILQWTGSAFENVTTATLLATGSIDDLSDVTLTGADNGDVLVWNSTGGGVVNSEPMYYVEEFAAGTSFVVNHALNCEHTVVTVYEESGQSANVDNVIIPNNIIATDSNNTTVETNASVAVVVVVMGMKQNFA